MSDHEKKVKDVIRPLLKLSNAYPSCHLLNELNIYFKSVLDAVCLAFVSIDENGIIVFWNNHAQNIFGWNSEEIIGCSLANTIIPHKYRLAHLMGLKSFKEKKSGIVLGKALELSALHKDGHEFPIEITINTINIGADVFYFSFIQDITERKSFQEKMNQMNVDLENKVIERTKELECARRAADEANRIKSVFLANMSHEIRTPLGVVLGYSDLLSRENITQNERSKYHSAIKRNGELLSNIINDVLDLSKVEAGKIEISRQETLIADVLSDMNSLLHLKASSKGLKLQVILEKNVPKIIYTDLLRLRQILFNVVGNSIKFTDQGEIKVHVKLNNEAKVDTKLLIEVSDTGRGICEENRADLFKTFSRLDNSGKSTQDGAGLGLALAKKLAELLGGNVFLKESIVGFGSTFSIIIDMGIEQIPHNNFHRSDFIKAEFESKNKVAKGQLSEIKILLVEDSVDNRFLISKFLIDAGAIVVSVEDGSVALNAIQRDNFDLILMDLQMPVMDGYEAFRRIRDQGVNTPIIAITAHALNDEKERSLRIGFNDYTTKPISKDELISKVLHCLLVVEHTIK